MGGFGRLLSESMMGRGEGGLHADANCITVVVQ